MNEINKYIFCSYFILNYFSMSSFYLFCVLKKWVHYRIGQCVRPAVYTITLHNYIRLRWNFVHRTISSISRSSSKMRMIRQEMAGLSKKLSLFTRPSLRGTGFFFQKKYFSQNYLKHIWIDSVFNANFQYDISFEPNCSFITKHRWRRSQNAQKLHPETKLPRYVSDDQ